MAELVVRFDVRFSERWSRGLMAAAMFFAAVPELASESVTLTTYYPAPSGIYAQLITTGNTYLARDSGSVGIGNTAPAYKLDIGGNEHVSTNLVVDNGATVTNGITANTGQITGTYGLTPSYVAWATYGTGAGGAAIYNDNVNYNALVIAGNSSSGARRVTIGLAPADNLTVNGNTSMSGGLAVAGNVTVNNSATGGNGYIHINNIGTGCSASIASSGADPLSVCAPGQYATWNPGLYIDNGYQYQNQIGYSEYNGVNLDSSIVSFYCCNE